MAELLPFEVAIGRNANFQIFGEKGVNVKVRHRDPQKALTCAKTRRLTIDRENRRPVGESKKRKGKKRKSQTVIFRACAETPHAGQSLPYLEVEVRSRT